MDIKNVLITIFMVSILLTGALFIGDMVRQLVRGEIEEVSSIEISIIISAILLSIELAVVSYWKIQETKEKRKPTIDELVKEGRKITY